MKRRTNFAIFLLSTSLCLLKQILHNFVDKSLFYVMKKYSSYPEILINCKYYFLFTVSINLPRHPLFPQFSYSVSIFLSSALRLEIESALVSFDETHYFPSNKANVAFGTINSFHQDDKLKKNRLRL